MTHDAFTVEVDLDQHYDWERLGEGEEPEAGTPIVETADGSTVKRVLKTADSCAHCGGLPDGRLFTDIRFGAGAVDAINADREAAGKSREAFALIVAQHVAEGVMDLHAPRNAWVDIKCPGNPDLEATLRSLFELPRPPAETTTVTALSQEDSE